MEVDENDGEEAVDAISEVDSIEDKPFELGKRSFI